MIGMLLTTGCSSSNNRTILEVRQVDETENNARITDYDCAKTAKPIQEIFSEVNDNQAEEARIDVSDREAKSVRTTLEECYDSEEGPTYVRFENTIYKLNFLKVQ